MNPSDLDDLLPLALPVLFLMASGLFAHRFSPRAATWLNCILSVLLAAATVTGLVLLLARGLLRVHRVEAIGHLSPAVIIPQDHAHQPLAVMAAITLLVTLAATTRGVIQERRTLVKSARSARELPGDQTIVVLDAITVDAVAIPGSPGRIAVSSNLLAVLDEPEQQAVLVHEQSHLQHRHHLFKAVVRVSAAINPALRPLLNVVDYTIERWADEDAAIEVGDRTVVARSIGKAALASVDLPQSPQLGRLHFLGRKRPGPIPRRVQAMLAPPPRPRPGVFCVVLGIALVLNFPLGHDLEGLAQLVRAARSHTSTCCTTNRLYYSPAVSSQSSPRHP
ncbi:M56 family metallopeptidase [Actinomadura nitritigenes]|uniref:M56 family metallopeptidase n=1 Tax=Actinomadura nitritigenes TaxID=134602 RepID=UPI003D9356FB